MKKKFFLRNCVLVFLFCLCAPVTYSQLLNVTFSISDGLNKLDSAKIILSSSSSETVYTDIRGNYSFEVNQATNYSFFVSKGFQYFIHDKNGIAMKVAVKIKFSQTVNQFLLSVNFLVN